ncbi:MAG: GNAT family N-acetyltransferase [Lawsonibacter sp.]|nr:GNAT family N-acetyltransferase [Lawsonibacter sp.]
MMIRTATLADLEALAQVEAACFPPAEAATREEFRARLAVYPDHFWLLYDRGRLVSFVNGMVTDEADLRDEMYQDASLHREDGAWQMIFGVNTIPEARRQGYAMELLRRVVHDARAQGREGLVLTCKAALLDYYARLGFVSEGVSRSVHGGAVWYQMRLRF